MQNYTYNKEVETLLTQFVTVLDGAIVKRIDENGVNHGEIEVKYMYMPKGRIIHDIINVEQNITLPVVSISLNSLTRAADRQVNKRKGPLEYSSDGAFKTHQPIPIDLDVNVSGICKYQGDVDQIVSNFVPYFDPYVVISWNVPNSNVRLNNKIEWSGSITYNYPSDITPKSHYRVGFDTSFKIEGWMYKKYDISPVKTILPEDLGGGVFLNFYAPETPIVNEVLHLPTLEGDVNYSLQNAHNIIWIDPDDNRYLGLNPQYTILGDGIVNMTCVDVSNTDLVFDVNDMGANYVGDLSDFNEFRGYATFKNSIAMTGDLTSATNAYRLDLTNCPNITGTVPVESTTMEWFWSGTAMTMENVIDSVANIQTFVADDPFNRRNGIIEWMPEEILDPTTISNILYLVQYGWDIRMNYANESFRIEFTDDSFIVWDGLGGKIEYK